MDTDSLLSGRLRYDLPKFLGKFAAPAPTPKSLLLSPGDGAEFLHGAHFVFLGLTG